MIAAFGTTNTDKIGILTKAIQAQDINIAPALSYDVDSGVSDQPMGIDEIRRGAINRARAAFDKAGQDDAVGIGPEGGLIEDNGALDYICIVALVIQSDIYVGISSRLRAPQPVADRVLQHGDYFTDILRDYVPQNDLDAKRVASILSRDGMLSEAMRNALWQM